MNKKVTFISLLVIIIISVTICFIFNKKEESVLQNDSDPDFKPYVMDLSNSINNIVEIPVSTIAKEIEYIPLETRTESLLDEVVKVTLADSFIFVSDVKKLLQFDRQGRFIRQIGSIGRGPGEYISVSDFSVDNRKEVVYIYSTNSDNMLIFNFKGNFIKSFMFKATSIQFEADSLSRFMFHLINLGKKEGIESYSWLLSDIDGNIILRISYSLDLEYKLGRFGSPRSPLYLYNGDFHFMEYGIDTLYCLNNYNKKPYAVFSLGDFKMDSDIQIHSPDDYVKYEKDLWIYDVLEDQNFLYLTTISGISTNKIRWIFNKQTKELAVLKDAGFKDDYYGLASFWPKSVYNDSILIDYIDAYKLVEILNRKISGYSAGSVKDFTQMKTYLNENITETSNPILMIVNQQNTIISKDINEY